MSEVNVTELDMLKERAKMMGITFHPAISAEKLSARIAEHVAKEEAPEPEAEAAEPEQAMRARVLTKKQKDAAHKAEMTKLVRVRVACHNPNKREWEGEIFSVGNSVTGQMKKYVPFNNEEGWHIPYMMYLHLIERKCQIFVNAKGPRGNKIRKAKLIKEFAIERLPDLTQEELKALGQRQMMARGED